MSTEYPKELQLALKNIANKYGQDAVISKDNFVAKNVKAHSTGNLLLDEALGVNGFPEGRIIEIFGPEATGKSLIAQHVVANCQKEGGIAAYIDAEHDLDPVWAQFIGMDLENCIIVQPESGEQALDIAHDLIKSGKIDVVVVDSVAALVPLEELEGSLTDKQVGLQARMMSKALRKMRGDVRETGTCLIFLNQIRDKIGPMAMGGVDTPGGRALKFFSSVRVRLTRTGDYKEGTEVAGTKITAKVIKNKVATPHKIANYNIVNDIGFDNYLVVIDKAVDKGILIRSGSWVYFKEIDKESGEVTKGSPVGNGFRQIRENLINNPEIYEDLYNQVTKIEEKEEE